MCFLAIKKRNQEMGYVKMLGIVLALGKLRRWRFVYVMKWRDIGGAPAQSSFSSASCAATRAEMSIINGSKERLKLRGNK